MLLEMNLLKVDKYFFYGDLQGIAFVSWKIIVAIFFSSWYYCVFNVVI